MNEASVAISLGDRSFDRVAHLERLAVFQLEIAGFNTLIPLVPLELIMSRNMTDSITRSDRSDAATLFGRSVLFLDLWRVKRILRRRGECTLYIICRQYHFAFLTVGDSVNGGGTDSLHELQPCEQPRSAN